MQLYICTWGCCIHIIRQPAEGSLLPSLSLHKLLGPPVPPVFMVAKTYSALFPRWMRRRLRKGTGSENRRETQPLHSLAWTQEGQVGSWLHSGNLIILSSGNSTPTTSLFNWVGISYICLWICPISTQELGLPPKLIQNRASWCCQSKQLSLILCFQHQGGKHCVRKCGSGWV